VVVKKGTELPNEYILITAHYDAAITPGANDNASGTAGVLECARLLNNFSSNQQIKSHQDYNILPDKFYCLMQLSQILR